jgi:hypothetical protein
MSVVSEFKTFGGKPEMEPAVPTTRNCLRRLSEMPFTASRCSHCTSEIEPVGQVS